MNLRVVDPIIGAVIFGAIGGLIFGKEALIVGAVIGAVCGYIFIRTLENINNKKFDAKNCLTEDEVNYIAVLLTYSFKKGHAVNKDALAEVKGNGRLDSYMAFSTEAMITLLQQFIMETRRKSKKDLKPSYYFTSLLNNPFALGYIFGGFEGMLIKSGMRKKLNNFDAAEIIVENYKSIFDFLNGKGYILFLEETVRVGLDKIFLTGRAAGLQGFARLAEGKEYPDGITQAQHKLGL